MAVFVTGYTESSKLYHFVRVPENQESSDKAGKRQSLDLAPGIKFTGVVKSVKQHSIFIQLPGQKHIGRLHICEAKSITEFKSTNVGDRIECKILEVQTLGKRTWIELTSRAKHMTKMQGLDTSIETVTQDSLKVGSSYPAVVTSFNSSYSCPVQIHFSPSVRGMVSFDQIMSSKDLSQKGLNLSIGQQFNAKYLGNDRFSLLDKP